MTSQMAPTAGDDMKRHSASLIQISPRDAKISRKKTYSPLSSCQ